jgi:transcriptional regulator with XRE-family HTH domain
MKHRARRGATGSVVHPLDAQIGRTITARRLQLGISLAALASKVEVSERRLQSFESGRTSVAASELVAIGAALDIPVFSFFEAGQVPEAGETTKTSGRELGGVARSAETQQLLHAYLAIRDPESRRMLAKVTEKLAAGYGDEERPRSPVRKRRSASLRTHSRWLN